MFLKYSTSPKIDANVSSFGLSALHVRVEVENKRPILRRSQSPQQGVIFCDKPIHQSYSYIISNVDDCP